MDSIPQQIERKFRTALETEAKRISEEFPTINASVSSFIGRSNHRHVLGLQCLLTEASQDEADLVALCIETENLDVDPQIQLDISWGDPSGYVEAELFKTPKEFSNTVAERIETALPSFFELLRSIIKKGRPGG